MNWYRWCHVTFAAASLPKGKWSNQMQIHSVVVALPVLPFFQLMLESNERVAQLNNMDSNCKIFTYLQIMFSKQKVFVFGRKNAWLFVFRFDPWHFHSEVCCIVWTKLNNSKFWNRQLHFPTCTRRHASWCLFEMCTFLAASFGALSWSEAFTKERPTKTLKMMTRWCVAPSSNRKKCTDFLWVFNLIGTSNQRSLQSKNQKFCRPRDGPTWRGLFGRNRLAAQNMVSFAPGSGPHPSHGRW